MVTARDDNAEAGSSLLRLSPLNKITNAIVREWVGQMPRCRFLYRASRLGTVGDRLSIKLPIKQSGILDYTARRVALT